MYHYKRWPDDQIARHDAYLGERFPDCDTFFVSSMAAQAGLNERTFRNYLRTDPTLNFVRRLESGEKGTHSDSIHAWAEQRNNSRRQLPTWQTNFVREVHVTEVGAGSVVGTGNINDRK
jgi:hypothetical protein